MIKNYLITIILFHISLVDLQSQTQTIGSIDTIANSANYYSNQYASPIFVKSSNFFVSDSIKGKNDWVGVHSFLVKDINKDGFSDIFLSFFSGGEVERVPFKLFLYDTLSGKMIDRSELIKNNIGQTFNRKSVAGDLNGDNIDDFVCVSHPELPQMSSFDILFSDSATKTWRQHTIKEVNRSTGEGYFHGVAIGDVNNDGFNDIVLSNENTYDNGTITMLNNGKGEFTEIFSMNFFKKPNYKFGLSWTNELADMNNDGFLDLLYWHDNEYHGIAYGDGTGYFGDKIEQRFPKSNFSYYMDFDPVDLDNDGDLDLILTTTDYSTGWELIFLENKGVDEKNRVIWFDRSKEINDVLKQSGFYTIEDTKYWVPYIHVIDVNSDGILDILPQRPLSNGDNPWIVYGKEPWSFSYTPQNILEVPDKPEIKNLDHESAQLSWQRYTLNHPNSSKRVKGWKIYFSNKSFGDRIMVSESPIYIPISDFPPSQDKIVFDKTIPYPNTFFRMSTIDDSGFETPLSAMVSISCTSPQKPVINWNGFDLSVPQGYAKYQWYFNDVLINEATKPTHKPSEPGIYQVRVGNISGCFENSDLYNVIVTSIEEKRGEVQSVKIYPNPSTNTLMIDLGTIPNESVSICIYTSDGRLINKWDANDRYKDLEIGSLQAGVYFIQIQSTLNFETLRFVKQ